MNYSPSQGMAIEISEREYRLLAELIYERSGINLGDNKKELVKARLMKRIRFYGFPSYREYYEYVLRDASGNELVEMLDAISTNVTSFFRENQHFDFMTKKVLPAMVAEKLRTRSNRLRIWSTAASTGEEIYSILITLMEYLGDKGNWDIKILGTDISTKALLAAQKAHYDALRLKGVSPLILDRYFDRTVEQGRKTFAVKPFLKSMAVFRRFNLMSPVFPFHGKFDIIFCRNVMIYFDRMTQSTLIKKLHQSLDNKGVIFIGHSESIVGMDVGFESVSTAVYKKSTTK